MKYDFHAVDTHTTNLDGLIKAMDENTRNIDQLAKSLKSEFMGAGAEGYDHITNTLTRKLDDYKQSMQNLHNAISTTSGYGGLMNQTDKHNGNRFLNIKA